jgi:hypothetical protein
VRQSQSSTPIDIDDGADSVAGANRWPTAIST